MTRDDAKRIMENLAVISHFAAGGEVDYPLINCHGDFIHWMDARSVNLCCLGRYRIVGDQMKAHVKLNPKQLAGAPV